MDRRPYYFILFLKLLNILKLVSADTFSVKIGTEHHINVVDSRFLSFTVDPKYLFSTSEQYSSKECICMASSLTPAYIRLAGPSTSHMTLRNTTISINGFNSEELEEENDSPKQFRLDEFFIQDSFKDKSDSFKDQSDSSKEQSDLVKDKLDVTHRQWKKFVQWAKSTGFDLVFALNNEEKTFSGIWDPNTALNILTVAEKAEVGDIFWQLGYVCTNQSIEEYLNDLETLRVIIETFPSGRAGRWRVVGGDVTDCLHADSKSDFKDYVALSNDMMDAVLLNGNSSAHELERMSEADRLKLLKLLSHSETPLWLTETSQRFTNELERAADWMTSLGYSARNGFSVHFRELLEDEMYEPTLSFYMALLYKNLVGERVLNVNMESNQSIIFAHCTSLRHKPIPGALTLYGVNMDDEPARFSLKLSKKEEGGDIMQFILGHDHNGNIIVNGRAMYYEGDIKPVVKRVRPYKTLLINLPSKSFGFWVLANTNVQACQDIDANDNNKKHLVEAESVSDVKDNESSNIPKNKRSINKDKYNLKEYPDFPDISEEFFYDKQSIDSSHNSALQKRVAKLNNDLKNVFNAEQNKEDKYTGISRAKRQIFSEGDDSENGKRKSIRHGLKHKNNKRKSKKHESKLKSSIFGKLLQLNGRLNNTKTFGNDRSKKTLRFNKNKVSKRNSKPIDRLVDKVDQITVTGEKLDRKRRSIVRDKHNLSSEENEEIWNENTIETDNIDNNLKLGNILRKIHKQLLNLPIEINENSGDEEQIDDENDGEVTSKELEDKIVVKTKISDDNAVINLTDKSNHGLIKSTFENVFSILEDLNNNLNKFWNALTLLE